MRTSVLGLSVIILLVLIADVTHAQGMRFAGRVLSDSAQPLAQAQVRVEGTGVGVLTDATGNYNFLLPVSRMHGQTAKLTARLIGYRSTSVDVVLSGTFATHDFALTSQEMTLIVDPVIYPPPFTFSTADFVRARSDIVHAAGLKDLSSDHRSGQRELRIWTATTGSLELLRMVEKSGVASGELIRYQSWPDRKMRDGQWRFMSREYMKNCEHFKTKELIFTCRTTIPNDADWKHPWDELEAAGLWDLPSDETWETPILVDLRAGNPVTVELWDGQAYRAWSYVSPDEFIYGNDIQGNERAYAIWRVTRGVELLSKR